MNEVKVRVVDCYVYRYTAKGILFLLMKRNLNKIYEHLWQGVAGKIEEGETSSEAAIRELEEETGLSPINMFVADHVSKFYEAHGDRINLVPVFGIEVDSDKENEPVEMDVYFIVNDKCTECVLIVKQINL